MALSLSGKLHMIYKDTVPVPLEAGADTAIHQPVQAAATRESQPVERDESGRTRDAKAAHSAVGAPYGGNTIDKVLAAIGLLMRSAWDSSELPPDNAFTCSILLRTLGMLVQHGSVPLGAVLDLRKHELSPRERAAKLLLTLRNDPDLSELSAAADNAASRISNDRRQLTLQDVVNRMANGQGLPHNLKVLDYPPTPTLGYWFVAGVDSLRLTLPATQWRALATWSRDYVAQQIGLITAKHDARMDPVAMAMASCLAARLRKIALQVGAPAPPDILDLLPSAEELKSAVRVLFSRQAESGIWPKYFPLFHYPSAGANYCFSFELLEAILHEFDPAFLLQPDVLQGFERAVRWCEDNRLEHLFQAHTYHGWNSGGEITTLTRGVPESWATAVIHMFAFQLETVLNDTIGTLVLKKYRSTTPAAPKRDDLESFVNIEVLLGEQPTSVKTVLTDEILRPAEEAAKNRLFALRKRWSALLFGPPGTSKTSLVKAIAAYLGWPYVEINPSEFLKRGLEQVPIQADELFTDLMDLSKAVVLFDEMDAIVKRREKRTEEEPRLDPTSEMLTTSMLPKLAQLHEKAQVVFFLATNHGRDLDSAIKRPGRFDIWLCMGPPKWNVKLDRLDKILARFRVPTSAVQRSQELLRAWIDHSGQGAAGLVGQLDYFTFAELQSFLEYLCRKVGTPIAELDTALERLEGETLRREVEHWYATSIMLREKTDARKEYDEDTKQSRLQ
jgi:hypothetical protein